MCIRLRGYSIKPLRGTKSYPPPKDATDGKPGIHI